MALHVDSARHKGGLRLCHAWQGKGWQTSLKGLGRARLPGRPAGLQRQAGAPPRPALRGAPLVCACRLNSLPGVAAARSRVLSHLRRAMCACVLGFP